MTKSNDEKLESIVDEFISTRGLFDQRTRDIVASILIYGDSALAKKAKQYFHARRLKIPIEIVTEDEAKRRQGIGYFDFGQKRPYHFKIARGDIRRYHAQK